jgi:DNA-binding NtrC family response regulator
MNFLSYPVFSILLVDDEPAWLDSLSLTLERIAGITNVIMCDDSRKVMDILAERKTGLVLLDLTMPHLSGQEILRKVSEQYPDILVIILTGINQLETAVACMKLGAFDYFLKTEDADRLITGILHAIRMIEMRIENRAIGERLLGDSLEHPEIFREIITASKTMRSIFQYIESVAVGIQPILITGESGVGKDLVAVAVHSLSRRTGPMISVNVAGLDDNVFADTLFGHVKGAFTGAESSRNGLVEEAALGTLFLDEIGDLSMSSQVKLLRILQDGEFYPLGSDRSIRSQARIIVATNQDLTLKMSAGQFRKDLYYRFQIHKVHIPPLRERKKDIALLLDHFLELASKELEKNKPSTPKELVSLLETYSFPGNVRELKSMVYDAVTLHKTHTLSMDSFLQAIGRFEPPNALLSNKLPFGPSFLEDIEVLPAITQAIQILIEEAMRRSKGNQSQAARMLGISQSALNKRLKKSK